MIHNLAPGFEFATQLSSGQLELVALTNAVFQPFLPGDYNDDGIPSDYAQATDQVMTELGQVNSILTPLEEGDDALSDY